MTEVRTFLQKANNETRVGVSKFTEVSVRVFNTCVIKVSEEECRAAFSDDPHAPVTKCVDVVVKPVTAQINTGSVSSNLLALVRSNKPRFYEQLPRPLIVLNPRFWLDQDQRYGTAAVGGISTNLLELPALWKDRISPTPGTQLRLDLDGRKSLNEPFYRAAANLALSNTRSFRSIETFGFVADFDVRREPHGSGTLFANAARAGAKALLKFRAGPVTQLGLGAGYRQASHRYLNQVGTTLEHASEHAFETRAVVDGHWAGAFLRGAVWFDSASPDKNLGDYYRLAMLSGFSREFALRGPGCRIQNERCVFPEKNAPAIGVEAMFGVGHAWGNVPEYARFFGGNSSGNFLHDGMEMATLTDAPAGPLIRSFGRNVAGARNTPTTMRGGTAYWNFNLTVSLPVAKWSGPLIPPIVVTGDKTDCGKCSSLKDSLKNQVREGRNIYLDATAYQQLTDRQRQDLQLDPQAGLTDEEKERLRKADAALEENKRKLQPEADRIWQQITPMVNYVADHANLYAIKPIVMFDAASVSLPDLPDQQTRLAFGGGLQLNVVFAKFELGYLRTIRRLPGDQRGNFVVRMVFEKFF